MIAAAHSHSVYGKAFSSLGIPLAPITQDACIFYEDHTVIAEQGGAVVFDVDAGKEFASKFPTGKAAIHQNHGLFTVGESVDEAAFWFITMERSCQAQLLAMAAGTPKEIRPEYAKYTREQTGYSPRRLVLVPAALAGDLPHRSQSCSTDRAVTARPGRVERTLATAPPEALFLLSAISQYIGAAIAVSLFDEVEPQTVAWFRVMGATIALLAISPGFYRGWTRRDLAGAAIFGIATALMNLFFYLGIDRIDLGKSVAIEFLGPIAVAAATTRTTRNAGALVLAVAGVVTLGGVELADNALGVFFILLSSAMWALYIVVGSRVAQVRPGVAGLGVALAIGTIAITPVGAPTSGPVWTSATLLMLCCADRRVLERDRLRHRPVRAAPDPGAAILGAARAAAGHGARRGLDRARSAAVGARPGRACWPCSPASPCRSATRSDRVAQPEPS